MWVCFHYNTFRDIIIELSDFVISVKNKKRKAYYDKLEAQLKEWEAKIGVLRAKAEKAEAETRIKYYKQIEKLQVKQKETQKKLLELKNSGEDAWESVKDNFEKTWHDLKQSFDNVFARK